MLYFQILDLIHIYYIIEIKDLTAFTICFFDSLVLFVHNTVVHMYNSAIHDIVCRTSDGMNSV